MNKKSTKEEFVRKAQLVHGNRYSYDKVVYLGSQTKVEIICPIHGSFMQTPNHHLSGKGCPLCGAENGIKSRTKTQEQFISELISIYGDKYDLSKVKYVNSRTTAVIGCPVHGDQEVRAGRLLEGRGCPKCGYEISAKKHIIPLKERIRQANKIHNNKYNYGLISQKEYVDSRTKVPIICPIHGVFYQSFNEHISLENGCPKCAMSHGEERVAKFLEERDIRFVREYAVYNESILCSNTKLYIDFYLPDYNCFIEYNGRQHYEEVSNWRSDVSLEKQQFRDDAVKYYCLNHKIKLIEIPYTEYENIEKILKKKLKMGGRGFRK